jgi:integrase
VMGKTLRANISSMLTVIRVGTGREQVDPADVRLDVLNAKLVRDYQDRLRRRYELAAGPDEKAKRMARDRADRTSKSTIGQAQSIFCKRHQLIERYREAHIYVPKSVLEFRDAGAVGTMNTKLYFPPSDLQLKETFQRIEELKASECPELIECYYLFWAALATGCRRTELSDMKVSDLIEIDGRLWVAAGLGKDGKEIRIP